MARYFNRISRARNVSIYDVMHLLNVTDSRYSAWMYAAVHPLPNVGDFLEGIIKDLYSVRLTRGATAVDGGAAWGVHTIPMSTLVGPDGRVFAIEAIPDLAEKLARHLDTNGFDNVALIPKAISNYVGIGRFMWVRGGPGYSGLQLRDLPIGLETTVTEIDVPVTTLSDILANRKTPVRFIKLDLEGGEFHALAGALDVLHTDRPLIVLEHHDHTARVYGYTKDEWFDLFDSLHYETFDLFGRELKQLDCNSGRPWYVIAASAGSDDAAFIRTHHQSRVHNLFLRTLPLILRTLIVSALTPPGRVELLRLCKRILRGTSPTTRGTL
jgi:FkbM family methyltransferase